MSHDADKLIRQLSLVAFLMAERRLLTARDVKSNVEGYSEMSDEAFARRFYSDRAELTALGVPLQSQRDEFTGEELYTLRSENYFLDRLELDDDELAALQTALYYLEGKFAYAEPLRLALQNLALGRAGFHEPPTDTAERVRVSAPDYSPELAGRLAKLESAISKQRTVRFGYWSPRRARPGERTRESRTRCVSTTATGTSIGHDLDRDTDAHVQGLAHPRRHPLRDASRARLPDPCRTSTSSSTAIPRPWQIGEIVGRARIAVSEDTAWWVERTLSDAGTVEDGVFETDYANVELLAGWVLRQNGRAVPLEPDELVESVTDGTRDAWPSARRRRARASQGRSGPTRGNRSPSDPTGPVAPERFGVLQALLAHLLAACGDERSATISTPTSSRLGSPSRSRSSRITSRSSTSSTSAAAATPCTPSTTATSSASRRSCTATCSARPPKLTPLEARAIRLAIEYVGPTIAADAHTPLKRVRKKLEETFGRFDLAGTPAAERRLGRGVARQGARATAPRSASSSRSST